jgi:HD-GYP domain-containing protein (c-di-GMP phosphodiesterase class II)
MTDSQLTSVNPHYLDRVLDLGDTNSVCAAEDIFDSNGMKLLAKGAAISRGVQEKLIRYKLRKPLESSLSVADGVTSELVLATAQQLLEEIAPLQICLNAGSVQCDPLDVIARISLNGSMTMLLSLAYNSEEQRAFRHSVLVCLISTIFAIKAKLTSQEVLAASHAGLLHDIGEMYIAPAYLKSSAHLRPDEWKHVVVHPKVGQMIIQELTPYPVAVAHAVGQHHERHDGSGYPHQIGGKKITREGAVVAAAETLGGIFMRPENALQRACLAMKLIPGEFAPEIVSVISTTAQTATQQISADAVKPLAEHVDRLQRLQDKLMATLGMCVEISTSPLVHVKAVHDAQQRAMERLSTIRRSLISSGIGECHNAVESHDSETLFEIEVVARELEWRLRDIGRDLALRLSHQSEEVKMLFHPLVETLDKPN